MLYGLMLAVMCVCVLLLFKACLCMLFVVACVLLFVVRVVCDVLRVFVCCVAICVWLRLVVLLYGLLVVGVCLRLFTRICGCCD